MSAKIQTRSQAAFTLLEVLIAMGIFFFAIFAILELVSNNLKWARNLQQWEVDAGSIAVDLSLTNKVEEGALPTEVRNHFTEMYPGYNCDGQIWLVSTNGLYQVDLQVWASWQKPPDEPTLSFLLFRPESTVRPGSGLGSGFQLRRGGR